jgi:hypothetical protein
MTSVVLKILQRALMRLLAEMSLSFLGVFNHCLAGFTHSMAA